MTHPIPPGLDRSPMGQWAKLVANCTLKAPNGYACLSLRITPNDGNCAHGVLCGTTSRRFHRFAGGYQAFIPLNDTETEARLRWEAEMMAKHGETVEGVEGNPWIGWAKVRDGESLSDEIWTDLDYDILDIIWRDCDTKIAFLRPDDKARETALQAQTSSDLDPTREGSGRALTGTTAPAPETVEPALQVGTLAERTLDTVVASGPRVETWDEHVARRKEIIAFRREADSGGEWRILYPPEPPQHPLTTPPDCEPDMGSFWRRIPNGQ